MHLPESREARYSLRGKQTTTRYKAMRVAERSLRTYKIEPKPFDPEYARAVSEEILGRGWKAKPGAVEDEKKLAAIEKRFR